MLIVTQTDALGERLGDEKAVEIICQSGFTGIDYSMFDMDEEGRPLNRSDYADHVLRVKEVADRYCVPFVQSHAPFPSARKNNEEYNKQIMFYLERAFDVSFRLGVKTMVVHPISFTDEGTDFDLNYNFYQKLIPYIKQTGVKVALENMWGRKEHRYSPTACGTGETFRQMMDMLDPELFVACLDIGHCGMVGQTAQDMIRSLGHKHLHALHIHDNDKLRDAHIFPFNGLVDWDEVTKALAEIDYDGNLTFESDNTLKRCPDFFMPTATKYLFEIGKALEQMINSHKK